MMKTNKIIIAIFSGLGNQMFQYAFYKYLLKKGYNVFLDKQSSLVHSQTEKHETFRLDYFNLPEIKYAKTDDIKYFLPKEKDIYCKKFLEVLRNEKLNVIIDVFFYKFLLKITKRKNNKNIWIEWDKNNKGKEFYRKNLTRKSNIYMIGRFQEYYFLHNIKEDLLKDFSFLHNMPHSINQYKTEISKNNSVSIHVRCGDYLNKKEFDICKVTYYERAVEYIESIYKNIVYYIFSDDLEYVKENFNFLSDYNLINNSQYNNSDYYDLYLMSICKHNIIPNSTFSWWSAYLNNNINKIVICPDKWNGYDFVTTDEICPKEWIRIPTK